MFLSSLRLFMSGYLLFFFLRIRRPPRSTRTDTLFPYTTLVRSLLGHAANGLGREPGAAAPLRRRDPIDEIERVGVDPCGDDRGLAHVSNVYIRYAAVNLAGSRPRLAGAADLPFVGGQPFERDRAACMEATRRDPDFGAQPEFAAVGELGRGVPHHDRRIDAGEECLEIGRAHV